MEYFFNSEWKSSSLRELGVFLPGYDYRPDKQCFKYLHSIPFLLSISFSVINFCDFHASDSRWSGSLLLRSVASQSMIRS